MTFLQLQQRLARRRGATSSTLVSATATRYQEALNETHRAILRAPGFEQLRRATVTFASVADTQQYALPMDGIARVERIFETTNDRSLQYHDIGWLRANDPDPVSGTAWAWIPAGFQEVHTQPADASEVFVKSTSASDATTTTASSSTDVTAYVEGIITGGYARTANVAMTGASAVSLSSAITNFIRITKFYLSTAASGTVTLHEDSGSGTELSKIAVGDSRAQFYSVFLYPTPSSVITYTADILRTVLDMSNDTDEPLLPEDFHDVLVDGAELRELTKQDDPHRWTLLQQRYRDGVRDLRSFVINHPDWSPQWGGGMAGISRLGSEFPVDQVGSRF